MTETTDTTPPPRRCTHCGAMAGAGSLGGSLCDLWRPGRFCSACSERVEMNGEPCNMRAWDFCEEHGYLLGSDDCLACSIRSVVKKAKLQDAGAKGLALALAADPGLISGPRIRETTSPLHYGVFQGRGTLFVRRCAGGGTPGCGDIYAIERIAWNGEDEIVSDGICGVCSEEQTAAAELKDAEKIMGHWLSRGVGRGAAVHLALVLRSLR